MSNELAVEDFSRYIVKGRVSQEGLKEFKHLLLIDPVKARSFATISTCEALAKTGEAGYVLLFGAFQDNETFRALFADKEDQIRAAQFFRSLRTNLQIAICSLDGNALVLTSNGFERLADGALFAANWLNKAAILSAEGAREAYAHNEEAQRIWAEQERTKSRKTASEKKSLSVLPATAETTPRGCCKLALLPKQESTFNRPMQSVI